MRELQTVIQISAPIDRVWRILTDFEHWKDWNPMVNHASGSATVRSKLNITMRGPNSQDAMQYQPTVLEVNPPKSLRWRATMMSGFMFTNDRVLELKEKNGGTEFINKEEFSGLMVPLFWNKMNQFVVPMLEKMNKALKDKVEAQS
ncbi:MAG: SRPBCC domain-containing protein [Gammaproteobacteria bacterium]|nr:SRPBCC domain-containing protein [Gammaproteobacteria bacterium]